MALNQKPKRSTDPGPKQCPNCSEPNKTDSKFCAKCRMVLTYDVYQETNYESENKNDAIATLSDEVIKLAEEVHQLKEKFR